MHSKTWAEVEIAIQDFHFPEQFDLIVAIANGGIIPAALLNQRLLIPIELVKLSFRDPTQKPMFDVPKLVAPLSFDPTGKTILLVEDRVKTGATLELAKSILSSAKLIKTFAVNGKADYALFDEACFRFPWIMENRTAATT